MRNLQILISFLFLTTIMFGADFDIAVKKTLAEEGSRYYYSAKHGERSKYGIRSNTLRHFNKQFDTDWYVRELKEEQAIIIYYELYWKKPKMQRIHNNDLANNIFDFGVNSGPGTAVKVLQRLINEKIRQEGKEKPLVVDGALGPKTAKYANKYCNKKFIQHYKRHRLDYLKTLKSKWKDYRYTWTLRVKRI